MKKTILLVFVLCHFELGYSKDFLDYYASNSCNYREFNEYLFDSLVSSINDTLPLNMYNNLWGINKAYYYKNDIRKTQYGMGKVDTSAIEIEDGTVNIVRKKVYNRLLPICKENKGDYINIYTLNYSFEKAKIELIVINNKGEIISGLVLLIAEINYKKMEINFLKVATKLDEDIYIQEKASDSPDLKKTIRKFIQRSDGYFIEL